MPAGSPSSATHAPSSGASRSTRRQAPPSSSCGPSPSATAMFSTRPSASSKRCCRSYTNGADVSANAEQVQYWTETAGPKWVRYEALLDRQIGPLGLRAMERGRIGSGESVLDVGCGCGDTSVTLGRRVGPGGGVLGVDISPVMLERARQRAADQPHVGFVLADAQSHRFEAGTFD